MPWVATIRFSCTSKLTAAGDGCSTSEAIRKFPLSATGEVARAAARRALHDLNVKQYCCGGLNFGYYYDRSPLIPYDGEAAPAYSMDKFTPSTVPGCRTPHPGWTTDARSSTRWGRSTRCCDSIHPWTCVNLKKRPVGEALLSWCWTFAQRVRRSSTLSPWCCHALINTWPSEATGCRWTATR